MKPREAIALLRPAGGRRREAKAHALRSCHDVDDVRKAARRRLPRVVFDYIDGGADAEATIDANAAAFRRWQFAPRSLVDVSAPDLTTQVFGQQLPLPIGLAPTGYSRMAHPAGELAVAAAAAARGLPYCVSTVATTAVEDVARVAGHHTWCQLYVLRDRGLSWDLMQRAHDSGVTVLEVSVDTAVAGHRSRDVRNGLTIPPTLGWGALLDIGRHPGYWVRALRAPVFEFANLTRNAEPGATVASITDQFDSSLTWDDVVDIRGRWPGKLVIKGPVSPVDAKRATSLGADGIHLSNHGGRQLDRCIPALDLVRPVRQAVGDDVTVIVDSGVRHGMDVVVALARGADLVMLGRPYLYALAVGGQAGVEEMLSIIEAQTRRTVQLLGVSSIADLHDHADDLVVPTGAAQ